MKILDVISAMNSFLALGEESKGKSHSGYFSPGGWAYETLKQFVKELEAES